MEKITLITILTSKNDKELHETPTQLGKKNHFPFAEHNTNTNNNNNNIKYKNKPCHL